MKNKQNWNVGDFFSVPLQAASEFGLGQILAYEGAALGAVACAFFGNKYTGNISPVSDDNISTIYVSNHYLNNFRWKIVGNSDPVVDVEGRLRYDRSRGFVGVEVYGAEVVEDFLNAFFGNIPWNSYFRPDFFDEMLVSPEKKPSKLIYK